MLVESFIQNIVLGNPEINIIDFVKNLNEVTNNIDISFIEEFIDLVGRVNFCVPHTALFTYGVLTERESTHDIKRLLDQNEFTEGKDYTVFECNLALNSKRGRQQLSYSSTPKTFKYILMRSIKQRKFAEYYLFLEEALSYYSEFQKLRLKQQQKFQLMDVKEKGIMRLVDQFKHGQLCIIRNEEPCEYKYGVIRGQFKHVVKMLRLFNVHEKKYYSTVGY